MDEGKLREEIISRAYYGHWNSDDWADALANAKIELAQIDQSFVIPAREFGIYLFIFWVWGIGCGVGLGWLFWGQ